MLLRLLHATPAEVVPARAHRRSFLSTLYPSVYARESICTQDTARRDADEHGAACSRERSLSLSPSSSEKCVCFVARNDDDDDVGAKKARKSRGAMHDTHIHTTTSVCAHAEEEIVVHFMRVRKYNIYTYK